MNVLMVLKCILNKHKCKLHSVQLHSDLNLKCVFKCFAEFIQPCGTREDHSVQILIFQNQFYWTELLWSFQADRKALQ